LKHDSAVLVEERVRGREVTVGVLAGEPLPVVEIRPKDGGYDYANKYTAGATEYLCPAPFERGMTERIQAAGMRAFAAVGGRDYGRVDVMVREDGQPLVLEVNTLPGMTETSLLPKAAAAVGIGFGELCSRMLGLAMKRASAHRESRAP
jgi:D-alanine-D-alanine ligase